MRDGSYYAAVRQARYSSIRYSGEAIHTRATARWEAVARSRRRHYVWYRQAVKRDDGNRVLEKRKIRFMRAYTQNVLARRWRAITAVVRWLTRLLRDSEYAALYVYTLRQQATRDRIFIHQSPIQQTRVSFLIFATFIIIIIAISICAYGETSSFAQSI